MSTSNVEALMGRIQENWNELTYLNHCIRGYTDDLDSTRRQVDKLITEQAALSEAVKALKEVESSK